MPLLLALVVAGVPAADPASALAPSDADRLPPVVLDRPARAESAITGLGPELSQVAARHDLAAGELSDLLRGDRTLWVDRRGRLLAIDDHLPAPAVAQAPAAAQAQAPFPQSETFRLHSLPGASRVIHIDFDGHVVAGTAWGVSNAPQPRFDTDGRPATFSASEHEAMQGIWQRVAEDFAPFAVDVTTEEPPLADLERTSGADARYGTRVLVTPSAEAHDALCGGCGGVAYVGTFDLVGTNTYHQPAWVFSHMLAGDEKHIAEAVSHEAGHNLGLWHDGVAGGTDYHQGHGAWAPIMGVGYDRPVVQFSAGEYGGANELQDDLAVIEAYGVPRRADDHGDVPAAGTRLGPGPRVEAAGVLSTRGDRDVFTVDHGCTGPLRASVAGAPRSPNADLRLRLLAEGGAELARHNPPVRATSPDAASGLGASLEVAVPAGRYHLEVDGVGALDPVSTGYSDYGSLGSYALVVARCTPSGAPDVVVTDVSWSPASPVAGSPVRFSALVRNQGTAATPAGAILGVGFQLGGLTRTWSDTHTAPLAPGASVTLTANGGPSGSATWSATAGSHQVVALVDGPNRIPGELDEANNTRTEALVVRAGPPALSVSDVSVGEGHTGSRAAAFEVTLSAASSATVKVTVRTADGTAVAPGDYTAKAATVVTFSPGQTSKTVSVPVRGDRKVEPSETFRLDLSAASRATVADGRGVATITNDD